MLLSEGQISDYRGAALMAMPCPGQATSGRQGYDADRFRAALAAGLAACIP